MPREIARLLAAVVANGGHNAPELLRSPEARTQQHLLLFDGVGAALEWENAKRLKWSPSRQ